MTTTENDAGKLPAQETKELKKRVKKLEKSLYWRFMGSGSGGSEDE